MNPCIAIIDQNTLSNVTLRSILWDIYNKVEVFTYGNMDSFIRDSNRHFVHFFVSADILFKHVDEFELLKHQTTVLSTGPNRRFETAGFNVLDISLPEKELMGKLLRIQLVSRYEPQKTEGIRSRKNLQHELSAREKEVLKLIVKGQTNKEIASELDISITTVIFHRNNVCSKLGTRSIGRITIYAVLAGLVEINDI
jgi:DNA-binding NarL/FixJ family response regulator